jgi:F1F0 ATPase subunit 2
MASELTSIPLTLTIGLAAGVLYFAGLWWTVQKLTRVRRPAVLTLASFLFRTVGVVAVFAITTQGRWEQLIMCLIGFFAARIVFLRRIRPPAHEERSPAAAINREGTRAKENAWTS